MKMRNVWTLCLLGFSFVSVKSQLEFDIKVPRFADLLNRVTNTTFGLVRGGVSLAARITDRVVGAFARVEDRLRALLEEFRGVLLRGVPELRIPVLDPLRVREVRFDVRHDETRLAGAARNLTVRHISKFRVARERFRDLGGLRFELDLNLTFPYVRVDGDYEVDGRFGDTFLIYGDGPFWLNLIGLEVATSTTLKFNLPAKLRVEKLSIDVKLQKLENYFDNLMRDKEIGDLFNKAISRMAPEALDLLWPDIKPSVETQIQKYVNGILENATVVNFAKRLFNINN